MAENFYDMYLEEMGAIPPFKEGEKASLLEKTAKGDSTTRNRLVEGCLVRALELSKEYEGRELLMADIVQEANTALMLAAAEYDGSTDWDEAMEQAVRESIELALAQQKDEAEAEENMTARVNVLQTVSQVLAQELGREATVEELAAKMKMTVDDVKDIMKLALDALTVNGQGQAAEAPENDSDEEAPSRDGYGRSAAALKQTNPMRDGWDLDL